VASPVIRICAEVGENLATELDLTSITCSAVAKVPLTSRVVLGLLVLIPTWLCT